MLQSDRKLGLVDYNMSENDDELESLMDHLGEFGRYQKLQYILQVLAAFTAGVHMLSLSNVAFAPEHRCYIPEIDGQNSSLKWDDSAARQWIGRARNGEISQCSYIDNSTNKEIQCSKFIYNTEYYKSSRAMEWTFVCEDRWKGAVAQTIYMLGTLTGALVLGTLADKYGRKVIFYISAVMQLIIGVGISFIPHYIIFLVINFFYGMFGSAGAYITGFVLSMELVGTSRRTACGISFQGAFAAGIMMVSFWAWIISDYRILQCVYGAHSLLLIGHWWLLDESIRWLWGQQRYKEALDIAERANKLNGGPPINKQKYMSQNSAVSNGEVGQSYGIIDLFRTKGIALKTMNICLNWFANSLVYYGLTLNTGKLEGNPFLVAFLMALVEIPCYILTVYLVDKVGRRFLTSFYLLVGGACCMIAIFTGKGKVHTIAIIIVGKFCISGSFAIIYNYSAELFPTVVRNTGMGAGTVFARLSGSISPLISLLDTLDLRIPSAIFATVSLFAGVCTMFLPETLNQPMPQTLEDGDTFGAGDTCFTTGCLGRKKKASPIPLTQRE